jgi:phage replication-related protein YjqB (UPF0714/DUF867 family)
MLAELLAHDGVVEHCELRSPRIGFVALHGGLEAMTFEIAAEAARRSAASLYAVVQPDDLKWHIPSSRHDVADSDALRDFCAHVDVVISVHGYGGVRDSAARWTTVLLGGSNRVLAGELSTLLGGVLPDYTWVAELEHIPAAYRGMHEQNPVNRPSSGGVQIELPPRVRGISPIWDGAVRNDHGFVPHTESLVAVLAATARATDGSCR